MSKQIVLHDTRLAGTAPAADLNISVDGSDPLRETLLRVRQFALPQTEPVELEILCHGSETPNHHIGRRSIADSLDGGGLRLCREGLRSSTMTMAGVLRGVVNTIVVYVCGPAAKHPPYVGTNHNGQQLFRELAVETNATIFAADATQWYWHLPPAIPNSCVTVMDFRAFEGFLWRFRPDGSTTIVESDALVPAQTGPRVTHPILPDGRSLRLVAAGG